MSQYSEMIGSFIRTGNYPMEANYIFETYEDLVDFYSDEVQKATLHKGLLKIVEYDENDKQALYWVTKNQDDELVFTKLISGDNINDITEALEREIQARELGDLAIWGTDDRSQIPDDLNSIYDLATLLLIFKETIVNTQGMFDMIKAIVGCPGNDILGYLETLDYNSLTATSRALHKFLNTRDPEDPKINTLPELQDFLGEVTNDLTLSDVLNGFKEDLWGDPIPSAPFRTMRGIEDLVETLASVTRNRDNNLQTELDQTQVGVGLSGDGSYNADNETHYLKNATSVMNALKILDGLINEAINNCNIEVQDTNTVNLSIDKYSTNTILTANVLLSTEAGNGIIAKSDGLYHKITSEYTNGVLTLKVNDNIVALHVLGLAFVGIRRAYYETSSESIVMEFKKEDGTSEELRIPVTQLIREWITDNSGVTDTVVLTRVEDYNGGPDRVSADVRLFANKYNILTKEGNTLYVKGTADNIVWNDVKVSVLLDLLAANLDNLSNSVTGLEDDLVVMESDLQEQITNEITRALQAELELSTSFEASQAVQDAKIDAIQTQANANTASYLTLLEKINDEITDRSTETTRLSGLIATERNRAEALEGLLDSRINTLTTSTNNLSTALLTEITRATNAEQTNATAISTEQSRALAKEAEIQAQLNAEISRSQTQDQTLADRIFTLNNEIVQAKDVADRAIEKALEAEAAYTTINNKVDMEEVRAKAKEDLLEHAISDEESRATAAEEDLLDLIDAMTTGNAGIASNLLNEIIRATAAEDALSSRLDAYWEDLGDLDDRVDNLANLLTVTAADKSVEVTSGLDSTTIKVNLSEIHNTEAGRLNIITLEGDGLHADVNLSYNSATNTLTFTKTGANPLEIPLVSNSIVDLIVYDKVQEALVISYTVNGLLMPNIVVPVRDLINEWTIRNTSSITLSREIHEGNEPDVLSALVNLSISNGNILEENSDGLFVDGMPIQRNTENIAQLQAQIPVLNTKIDNEITRALALEVVLNQKISSEEIRALAQESILDHKIEDEESRAIGVETTLKDRIDDCIEQITIIQNDIRIIKEEKADKSMLLWRNAEAYDLGLIDDDGTT